MNHLLVFLTLYLNFSLNVSLAQVQQGRDYPMIPVNTNYSYWDHHWIMWTPQHPKYEAIEVMVQDDVLDTESKLIRIFFTEREGEKRQVHYFNDTETAKNWRGEAYFRSVEYKTNGGAGNPLDLSVKFMDKDSLTVEWSMNFTPDQILSEQHSGLKDQGGHAAETVFLIFSNGQNATTSNARLTIDGKDFSAQSALDQSNNNRYYVAAYSVAVHTAVISYSQSVYAYTSTGIRNNWERVFSKSITTDSGYVYLSNSFGYKDKGAIKIETNLSREILTYSHLFGDHSFMIKFIPSLPSLSKVDEDRSIRYIISLDRSDLINGNIRLTKEKSSVKLIWEHQSPAWTENYLFQSNIQPSPNGYIVSSKSLRKKQ